MEKLEEREVPDRASGQLVEFAVRKELELPPRVAQPEFVVQECAIVALDRRQKILPTRGAENVGYLRQLLLRRCGERAVELTHELIDVRRRIREHQLALEVFKAKVLHEGGARKKRGPGACVRPAERRVDAAGAGGVAAGDFHGRSAE